MTRIGNESMSVRGSGITGGSARGRSMSRSVTSDELPMLWHDEFFSQLSGELTNVMLKTMPEAFKHCMHSQ